MQQNGMYVCSQTTLVKPVHELFVRRLTLVCRCWVSPERNNKIEKCKTHRNRTWIIPATSAQAAAWLAYSARWNMYVCTHIMTSAQAAAWLAYSARWNMYVCTHIMSYDMIYTHNLYIYIYIYIERERLYMFICICVCVYIYIYITCVYGTVCYC